MSPRFASAIDEEPGRARVGADVLEGAEPVGAERLEERELRLDRDDVRRTASISPQQNRAHGVGRRGAREVRVAADLDREQLERGDRGRRRAGCACARRRPRAGRRSWRRRPASAPPSQVTDSTAAFRTSAGSDLQFRRRTAQERADQEQLVGVGRVASRQRAAPRRGRRRARAARLRRAAASAPRPPGRR